MKKGIGYIVVIAVLLGIFYLINYFTPKQYDWSPTYSRHDKNPFGAYVFDKILEKSWDHDYIHSYKTITRLTNEEELKDQNLLIITQHFSIQQDEMEIIMNYISEGHQVMIIADYFDNQLSDTLKMSLHNNYKFFDFWNVNIRDSLRTLYFSAPNLKNAKYKFPAAIIPDSFNSEDSTAITIAFNEDSIPVMMRFPIGEGNLILGRNPRIFTNYGILDPINNHYIWTALSYLKGAPLIRSENYHIGTDESKSLFRYVLSNRSLRWAYYITLLTILLFIIFTAKRKQKAIPVIKEPENKMLAFVRSLSDLYLRRNNNADIVRKKYIYWADNLKRQYGIDIINVTHDNAFFAAFSSKTGKPLNEVKILFRQLDEIDDDTRISDTEMMQLIEKMKN